MSENNAVVGIYDIHTDAEAAVMELQKSGFDMQKLSIVGKDYHTEEHVIGYYNAGDRMKFWATHVLKTTGAAHIAAHQEVLTP